MIIVDGYKCVSSGACSVKDTHEHIVRTFAQ